MARHKIFTDKFALTHDNKPHKQSYFGPGGVPLTGLIFRPDESVLVESGFGNTSIVPKRHAASIIDVLADRVLLAGGEGIAVSLNIKTQTADPVLLEEIADAVVERANERRIIVLDYNHAVLGDRLAVPLNISGTVLGSAPLDYLDRSMDTFTDLSALFSEASEPRETDEGLTAINHKKRLVFMRSYSLGLKSAFYSVMDAFDLAGDDLIALRDYATEIGGEARGLVAFFETKGYKRFQNIEDRIKKDNKNQDIRSRFNYAGLPKRINLYKNYESIFFADACVIGLYDQNKDQGNIRMNGPKLGDYVYALRGSRTPRISGLDDMNEILVELYGQDWYECIAGDFALRDFLIKPATSMYKPISKLQWEGVLSGVFFSNAVSHYASLAAALRSEDLLAVLGNIFPPHWLEKQLITFASTSDKFSDLTLLKAYERWSMGTECIVTSSNPELVSFFKNNHVSAEIIGRVQSPAKGYKGVLIYTPDKEYVHLSGPNA